MTGRLAAVAICLTLSAGVARADAPPVARWDFGAEEATPLRPHGSVHRDVPGPRPPEYPDFDAGNTAVRLDGHGSYLAFDDPGVQSPFDFGNGDAITLEAWVRATELHAGENVYVIGKGRTGASGFDADNQNWALRVREVGGKAGVSFLFATAPAAGTTRGGAHWHRWTTSRGFAPGPGWHHIAVSYRFGDPKSIRGWIDGKPEAGKWDMGGPTTESPVVDNDAVWIGSSRGGAAANSFRGSLDAVAIHREIVPDAVLKKRFRREGGEVVAQPAPEEMPAVDVPAGKVVWTLHEGFPAHTRWLETGETVPPETTRFQTESFLMDRLPRRYDAWGIRDAWKAPTLVRMAADVDLPAGRHRFLVRVRGLSRLWVDGTLVARGKPLGASPNGEEPITPLSEPPLPGHRPAEHRQQEVFGEATVESAGPVRVVLETLVGGKNLRTDPGEICVAVLDPETNAYALLTPRSAGREAIPLTNEAVTAALARLEQSLGEFDDAARRRAASSQDEFWKKRHHLAREWVKQHPAPAVPPSTEKGIVNHPIDAFLAAKVERALAESAKTPPEEARQFHRDVLPVLRDNCFRCHGDKENGGLRLHTREAALKAGESEAPAVVPGDPAASELIRRVTSANPDERMPPGGEPLPPAQVAALTDWIKAGAAWPAPPVTPEDVAPPPVLGDAEFLRRVYFDTVGVPPTEAEVEAFVNDGGGDKRSRLVDRLLDDERGADHWMSYWQDVLAENPTIINPSLNTTGPFRWFLYDALRDRKPLDRLATELILLRGNAHEGGSAGFGIAADNDAPLAAKAQIVASAFLGVELQCARCHDSPYHSTKQRDLYAMAAMLQQKPVTVPKTSRVPAAFFEKKQRESLIKVTLRPDESILPAWPFAEMTGCADDAALAILLEDPKNTRERLAALVTAPANERFAQVIVNRVWRRLLGAGFVEPPHDWEGHAPSHPELLRWLAREFVTHDYDVRHLSRLILTSDVYRRAATGRNLTTAADLRFFTAPDRRRLSAEQVVDALYQTAGQPMDVEEITFDPDGRRAASNRLTLGVPKRAWMFASLANERDRPSLSLPRARAVTDLMEAFGWTGSRQSPRTDRETAPNVLQPGVLANSTLSVWLTRAAAGSGLADAAVTAESPAALVDRLFLRYLGRRPSAAERDPLVAALTPGFADRIVPESQRQTPTPPGRLPTVTWSNHLTAEATTIALELERRARAGPDADPRLRPEWREVYEDVVWSIVNIREFVWLP